MRTDYSIKNSITSFVSNIISFIFLFISQTIFIKIMGIEYTGLNGLFSNILTLLNLFELGIGSAITFHLYKAIAKDDKEKIKTLMKFYNKAYNIISLCILSIGLIITPFIKIIVKDVSIDINIYMIYILFLVSTVSTYILAYKRNLLYAYQKNYILNNIHVGYLVILNILQLIIIYITKNYYLYLIIKIICILGENIFINKIVNKEYKYLLDKDVKRIDKKTTNSIISRVKALFIHKVSGFITYSTDNILISYFFGLTTVGLYTSYYYIINAIDILFRGVIASSGASVGDLLVIKDYNKRFEVFKKIRFINFWISIFTSICLLFLIEPFIKLWLGNKYLIGRSVLIVLIINYYLGMMRTVFNIFKDAAGIWVEDRIVPIIQAISNIVLSIIFLRIFGLSGVFLGTIISSLIVWVYSYPKFVYKKLFNKNYVCYYLELIKEIVIFCIICIITYFCIKLFNFDNLIIELVIKGIICLLLPNILLYILFRNSFEYKYFVYLLKVRIGGVKNDSSN